MTLYEISQALIEAYEQSLDPETGEILDEELFAKLADLEQEKTDKIEGVCCWIKNLRADAVAIKEEAKALTERAKAAESKAEHLTNWISKVLNGEKFSTPKVAVSFRKSQSLEINTDIMNLPPAFLKFEDPKPDKNAIKAAIKEGQIINGCTIVEKLNMTIK